MLKAYPVDHSAFDGRAFELHDGQARVVYTGDLRAHGRTGRRFRELAYKIKTNPSAIILEGTTLGRDEPPASIRTESDVERKFKELISDCPGPIGIAFSPQNIDRLVSAFKAAKACQRTLLIDPYSALILNSLVSWSTIPKPDWPGIKVWFPNRITRWVRRLGLGSKVEALRRNGVRFEQIHGHPDRYLVLFRPSMLNDLPSWPVQSLLLIYSMWSGYLKRSDWQAALNHPLISKTRQVHISGHAGLSDLQWLCEQLKPERVIPIHTAHPKRYETKFANVTRLKDGEIFSL